jgi:hypothetical protein
MADEAPLSASESAVKLSAVWPYIEQGNERCTEVTQEGTCALYGPGEATATDSEEYRSVDVCLRAIRA